MKNIAIILFLLTSVTNIGIAQYKFKTESKSNCSEIKNQARTGTCWSFSTTSFLESEIMRMGNKKVDLSEMFIVRNIYIDKANNYMLRQGKANFSQGSLSHDLVRLIDQKGLVPEEVYSGLINGQSSHDHSELENGLKGFLDGVRKSTVLSQNWKTAFSSILDSYIGSVSEQFTYNEKPYTPQTFAEQLNLNTDSYKTITSFTHHPFYENFILEIPDNYSNGTYFNMPLDELMSTLDFAILAGYTVVWDGDVSEKGFSASNGIAILPIDNSTDDLFAAPREERKVTQENRQISFENYRTTDDHLMHIIGIATDQKGTKFYLTKNSWGERGEYSGYLYMSEAYVKMKTVALMLHKDGMPDDVRKKLKESK